MYCMQHSKKFSIFNIMTTLEIIYAIIEHREDI